MSNLSNIFRVYLKSNPELNQIQLARKLGIVPSHLTHILKGRRRGFGPKLLTEIILRISPKPEIQAQFLAAYLRDQFEPELHHLVDIAPSRFLKIKKRASKDSYDHLAAELRRLAVDEDIVAGLLRLGKAARSKPAMARVINDLAKIQ
jgi:hypothetical protein